MKSMKKIKPIQKVKNKMDTHTDAKQDMKLINKAIKHHEKMMHHANKAGEHLASITSGNKTKPSKKGY